MALSPRISNVAVLAMLDNSLNTLLNEGLSNAIVNVYTGAAPATCGTAASGTLLGTCVLNATPLVYPHPGIKGLK